MGLADGLGTCLRLLSEATDISHFHGDDELPIPSGGGIQGGCIPL
jgi:hypothetical protein